MLTARTRELTERTHDHEPPLLTLNTNVKLGIWNSFFLIFIKFKIESYIAQMELKLALC